MNVNFFANFVNKQFNNNSILAVISNCGASLSENNTYFESTGDETSHCSIQVCKASSNIVQVRKNMGLLGAIANTPKSEDKYVKKVFNSTELHFSEAYFFQNWYFE